MTESSPVLTVTRPATRSIPGSVGRAAARHRRQDRQPRCQRRRRGDRQGPERDGGLLREPRGDRADDRQRLAAHRRPRPVRRRRQPLHRRAQEGDDPRRRAARTSTPTSSRRLYGDSKYVKEMSVVGLPTEGGPRDRRGADRSRVRATTAVARGRARARFASTSRRSARACRCTSGSRCSTCGTTTCRRRPRAR